MAAKKPEGIPLSWIVERDRELPPHRQEMHRRSRERAMSTDGKISVADAIEDEYLRLTDANRKHRDAQSAKAKKPRGAGDDGRTKTKLIADVVSRHPADTTAEELLQHVHAEIEANGMKALQTSGRGNSYDYNGSVVQGILSASWTNTQLWHSVPPAGREYATAINLRGISDAGRRGKDER